MPNSADVSAGDTVLASQYNNLRKDTNLGGIVVQRTSSLSVLNTQHVAITWESKAFDGSTYIGSIDRSTSEGTTFWASGAPTRLTIPVAGMYLCGLQIPAIDVGTDTESVEVYAKRGSTAVRYYNASYMQVGTPPATDTGLMVVFPAVFATDDWFEWYITQTQASGTDTETFGGTATDAIHAWVVRLSY